MFLSFLKKTKASLSRTVSREKIDWLYYSKYKARMFSLALIKTKLRPCSTFSLKNGPLKIVREFCISNEELDEGIEATDDNIVVSPNPASIQLTTTEDTESMATTASEILMFLYTDQILCDIKLRTGKETFPAHRNILSARSPVFRSMFTNAMGENLSQFVDIPDVEANVLWHMLRYIYTNSLEDIDLQIAYELYAAADKYQILDLKNKCSIMLRSGLTRSNACDVLILADFHQDQALKTGVQNFIIKEGRAMFNSDEWKDFIKKNVQLATETMFLKCIME